MGEQGHKPFAYTDPKSNLKSVTNKSDKQTIWPSEV